jgi:hypothetical protein
MNSSERRRHRRKSLTNPTTHVVARPKDQTKSQVVTTSKTTEHKEQNRQGISSDVASRRVTRYGLWTLKWLWRATVFFGFWLGIVTGYLALLPRVSVSQNEQLDPSNTFSSPFIISNDGPLPMENVRFTCGIVDVKHENGPEMVGDANFGTTFFVLKDKNGKPSVMNFGSLEMMPGERSTMPSCSYPWLNPIENADVGIVVDFRIGYSFFSTRRIFRFGTLKDSAGKLHWFPLPIK